MEPFLGLLIALAVGVGLSIAQLLIAQRSGLATYQGTLVKTLQDNLAALTTRVQQLEASLVNEQTARKAADERVEELRDVVADLARENTALRHKLGMDPR